MAKFRRNHLKADRGRSGGSYLIRIIMFSIVLVGGLVFLFNYLKSNLPQTQNVDYEIPGAQDPSSRFYLPQNSNGQIIHHKYYSLSYNESMEQAEWVAYELTRESLKVPNVPRHDWFSPDDKVETRSAVHADYINSGYTRGHLAPAGDMAFNTEAMEESFYMSNISPQKRAFNNGIWRELEEQTRDWAFEEGKLYIVTGPVPGGIYSKIGKNRVAVPKEFYKVILDLTGKKPKGIGFVIENRRQEESLQKFVRSIDDVEALTGFNFFEGLMSEELESKVEAEVDTNLWKFSEKRYQTRLNVWNNQ